MLSDVMMIPIFDLSFVALNDLDKQAEDVDFFFKEYIRCRLSKMAFSSFPTETFRNYGSGSTNIRLSNSKISSVAGLGRLLTTLSKHSIITNISNLTWLDLSFNNISKLSTDSGAITSLKGLRYLATEMLSFVRLSQS